MAIETPNIGLTAYNDFSSFSSLSYACITSLMNNNELVWKLLKYPQANAWERDNLTYEEKGELIYAGQEDSSKYHVFMDGKQPDVMTEETTLLRIMPYFAKGFDRVVGYVEVSMEVFSHYKINHLTNYKTRIDSICQELLGLFNGINVGGIGLMSINEMRDGSARLFEAGQIPFGGKQLIFSLWT